MGNEDQLYTDSEWRKLRWRPCDRCGAPVTVNRTQASGFGSSLLYRLALAECTRQCSGPPAFGNHAYLDR